MKKNVYLILFCALTIAGGLLLSTCDIGIVEEGVGTLKLKNNSINVQIVYVSIENGLKKRESHVNISPGNSHSFTDTPTGSYTVYLEDADGDGWETKYSVTVRKDSTVEVNFKNDFKPSNYE